MTDAADSWDALLDEVPRTLFIPDTIWVTDDSGDGYRPVSKRDDPLRWHAAVAANKPVVTQVNQGEVAPGKPGEWPSSSCSQPSIVADMLRALDPQPGHAVLEIGTGTGWNAALLSRRVGPLGRVTTVEIDPALAKAARRALANGGYGPLVITADGLLGHPDGGPYDRVISTAAIRDAVPQAWIDQLRPGARLVTPWGNDWDNGVMLTLDRSDDGATGRFSGDLAFMRVRAQRYSVYGWSPEQSEIDRAQVSTTDCRGVDLDRMLDPGKGRFALGARLSSCSLDVEWHKNGQYHHNLELDDGVTRSWARLDAKLLDPAPLTVYQLGPRRLWDETVAAYDWWHDQGEPAMDRFGMEIRDGRQWIWLDDPGNTVRVLHEQRTGEISRR